MTHIHNQDKELIHLCRGDNRLSIAVPGIGSIKGGFEELSSINRGPSVNTDNVLAHLRSFPWMRATEEVLRAASVHPEGGHPFKNPLYKIVSTSIDEDAMSKCRAVCAARNIDTFLDVAEIQCQPHIGRHSLTVAAIVLAACSICCATVGETEEALRTAVLHDTNKIADLLVLRLSQAGLTPEQVGLPAGEEVKRVLLGAGLSEAQANTSTEAAGWTGHNSLYRFLIVTEQHGLTLCSHLPLSRILLHLADDMAYENHPHTTNERMNLSRFPAKYQFLWSSGLATGPTSSSGELVEVSLADIPEHHSLVGAYVDLQRMTSDAICLFLLQARMKTEPSLAPDQTFVSLVREKLDGWGFLTQASTRKDL